MNQVYADLPIRDGTELLRKHLTVRAEDGPKQANLTAGLERRNTSWPLPGQTAVVARRELR